ncbi:MAG: hypothetical protein ABS81_01015 [Pseudonocardia sp. SCN 72-86]|nr:MAG: hypothetical protein ABS81_01015 [Pseudonocardia sp. SCN 72-86]
MIAASTDPGQFNDGISTAGGTRLIAGNIFSGLTQIDENLTAQPDLATSWETPDNGLTWTFHLATGVTWHDGQPFSSADVKFTFDEILLKYHPTTKAGLSGILDRVDAPDANTVVFHFKRPYGPLPLRLGNIDAPILPQHLYQGTDPLKNPANQKPVGTGPFKFGDYQPGSKITLVRNESYFKAGLPHLDSVVFSIIPQSTQQVAALQRGEIDYVPVAAPALLDQLRSAPNITLKPTVANGNGALNCQNLLTFNTQNPALAKPEVRQAIAYAVDRQRILDQVQFGQGAVSKGPIASAFAWAQAPGAPAYPRDVAKANALLDQAGLARVGGGNRATLKMIVSGDPRQSSIIAENLGEIGIAVDVQVLDGNAANNAVFVSHTADLGSWGSCNAADPDIGVPPLYSTSNIQDVVGGNVARYSNPQLDALFVQAASTTDQAARAKAYQEADTILLRDLPYWWLTEQRNVSAFSTKVHDIANWSADPAERAWIDS